MQLKPRRESSRKDVCKMLFTICRTRLYPGTKNAASRSSLHRQRLGAAHVVAAHIFVPEIEDVVRGGDGGEVERRLVRQEEAAVGEVLVAGVEEAEEAGAREETVPHPVAQNKVYLVGDIEIKDAPRLQQPFIIKITVP